PAARRPAHRHCRSLPESPGGGRGLPGNRPRAEGAGGHDQGLALGFPRDPGGCAAGSAGAGRRGAGRGAAPRAGRHADLLFDEAQAGILSAVGVSNFTPRQLRPRQLRELRADVAPTWKRTGSGASRPRAATWAPDVIQTELHPWWLERELVRLCQEEGIHIVAYGSLGSPERKSETLANRDIQRIAEAHDLSPAQVLLTWAVQRGMRVIPTTAKRQHMRDALAVPFHTLSQQAMAILDDMPQWKEAMYHPYLEQIL
ncbi:unnamed protein product, partial [Polarella glacialis]